MPFVDRLAGKLSGGMKQKLGLACALVHTPEILFLDEPTNGVDPVSRRDFWRILYDLLREGVTIFLSTSYLDEAERCARIGLMHKGAIIIEDQPKNVRSSLTMPMMEVWTDQARTAGEIVRAVQGVSTVSVYGDRLHVGLERKENSAAVLGMLEREGIAVQDHREILPSLEDVFITMVEKRT
jgi:ABC-2 type transport system ATP-binding protein